ncbi:Dbl homology domain-containing protein [Trichoderma citrinoviride]|uniref:Dbl homology domain-containing protein n=1 Tax=Trichoderma citrinoviride TaxID=58853 RepID=A0A2T4B4D3_9HYPO|nr:Dbl homology domain-containing protein [Trichoderma citrinoviride]PTB64175.1 Dbl homology domain-containing protein [Trichoderma citrinoviride]
MQEYEDAVEYRSNEAISDTDGDAEVITGMAQLDIEATDAPPAPVRMPDVELQPIVETASVTAAIQVPQITIGDGNAPVIDAEVREKLKSEGPFHKWMRTIHRRARHRPTLSDEGITSLRSPFESEVHSRTPPWKRTHHRHSSSGSSFAFVTAVRSASASLASVSAVARSRRTTVGSQGFSTTERSSRGSISGPRASEDSGYLDNHSLADLAAIERSLQRRKVLEELISTEEGYIGDVRFLMNVYVTILAALPSICVGLRSSINQNLTEIVKLHEELLGELHRIVPHSEYTQADLAPSMSSLPNPNCLHTHRRWSSLGAIPEQNVKARWLLKAPGMLADPQVAAEVSKLFAKKISCFFIYEEYGATYEMMIKDIASAQQAMPDWETYQKGLEALALALGSAKDSEEGIKKALTINDLLVKPIQRICKYPLLFCELLKCTPISDCPNSHMEIDNTLTRLREATTEINRASDDDQIRVTLERTWILQDRLVFPDRKLDAISKRQIRSFGHIRLYDGVDGQYFICLLYRDVLCLASAGKVDPIYTIMACINVDGIRIEDVDNGRGLQCHTAPFSWKLVFECDHQLYELIMTACTPKEEAEWRARLTRPVSEGQEEKSPDMFSTLHMDIKSLGTVFGKQGTLARRISIQRATTVGGAKSPLCQVILKNTNGLRDHGGNASAASTIKRSQSLLTTTTRIPVLAPPRGERARLEALLSDVWTRDILPFPGMSMKFRSENLVRSSASTVMRKLSVASFASSFTKRSASAQRAQSIENIALERIKRRGIGTPMDSLMMDGVCIDDEAGRKAKRQRTAGGHAAIQAPVHSLRDVPRSLRRRGARIDASPRQDPVSDLYTFPSRAASANILLPSKPTSPRAMASLPENLDRTRKASAEKFRSFGRWTRMGVGRNEGTGSFRKLLSMGKEL